MYSTIEGKALEVVSTEAVCCPGDMRQCLKTFSLSQLWEIEGSNGVSR